ncbi:MAG: methyltransferase domain-containing protein [Polyangiaceae bacterium]|nr:methyltransferase domain-containing protein [Polyangiaceae bacterium]
MSSRSQSFDVVLAVTVLGSVADAAGVVEEAARVIVPDGRLVFADRRGHRVWAAWRRSRVGIGATSWREGRFCSPPAWRSRPSNVDPRRSADAELRGLAQDRARAPREAGVRCFRTHLGKPGRIPATYRAKPRRRRSAASTLGDEAARPPGTVCLRRFGEPRLRGAERRQGRFDSEPEEQGHDSSRRVGVRCPGDLGNRFHHGVQCGGAH